MKSKSVTIGIAVVIVITIAIAVFTISGRDSATTQNPGSNNLPPASEFTQVDQNNLPLWQTASLEDVNSGETFTVEQFRGTPVLLESFAVWCPTCTKQQREIQKLHDEVGESVISISLDADQNEDADRVRAHTESQGFDWRYVISPIEVTLSLVGDFGPSIVNAPSAPVILICPGGEYKKLDSGVKKVPELKGEVASCP